MKGPSSKKTKEPPKKANHKRNIKFFPGPLLSWEALLKGFAKQPPWKDETIRSLLANEL
jgi:hypothetical protein